MSRVYPFRLTPQQDKEIARLWKTDDQSLSSISLRYKVSGGTIKRSLTRTKSDLSKIQNKDNRIPIKDPKVIKRLIADYVDHEFTLEQVAAKYRVSTTFVNNTLTRNNVVRRATIKTGNVDRNSINNISTLWAKGKSSKSIAKATGMPRYQIALILIRVFADSKRMTKMCSAVIKQESAVPYKEIRPLISRSNLAGNCPICSVYHERLHVDHCHDSGLVRGLLCGSCNKGIGLLRDSKKNLKNAIKYLAQT